MSYTVYGLKRGNSLATLRGHDGNLYPCLFESFVLAQAYCLKWSGSRIVSVNLVALKARYSDDTAFILVNREGGYRLSDTSEIEAEEMASD